jgi:hypothetical protein
MEISADTLEFLLILLLFAYVVYLQLQLTKKNNILKSVYEKIDKPNSKLNKDDIIRFLENIKNPDYSGVVTKDKFLDKKVSSFLFDNESEVNLFLHYTTSEKVAKTILQNGFKFVNSFYKTAEYIYNDELYLIHRHHEHKQFGDYVIVICISKELFKKYTSELNKIKSKNIAVEQLLTETPPSLDENAEEVYTLPKQFIKGYFNYTNGDIVRNPEFNYNYNSDSFKNNLQKLVHH